MIKDMEIKYISLLQINLLCFAIAAEFHTKLGKLSPKFT